MRKPPRKLLLLAGVLAAAILIVLLITGGDDEGNGEEATTSTVATTTTDEEVVRETIDPVPRLADGWSEVVNAGAGFAFGRPPGWREREARRGQGSVVSSPDDLVVVSITADRTSGALSLPLDEFATRTAEALGSEIAGSARFEDLQVGAAAPFGHSYDAVAVRATGKPKGNGAPEKVLVVVIRREQLAAYVVVVRENAEQSSEFADRDTVKELIRSLRGRPPT